MARHSDRTTAIVIPVDREQRVGGYESWWDVPVAEVSTDPSRPQDQIPARPRHSRTPDSSTGFRELTRFREVQFHGSRSYGVPQGS